MAVASQTWKSRRSVGMPDNGSPLGQYFGKIVIA
jgi:hypothetical protein